jgi:hypothetical protein
LDFGSVRKVSYNNLKPKNALFAKHHEIH